MLALLGANSRLVRKLGNAHDLGEVVKRLAGRQSGFGEMPFGKRRRARSAFAEAANAVIAIHEPTWRSPESGLRWWASLETYAYPVESILSGPDAKETRQRLPLFITGHSLGGALALLATKLVAPDVTGACYTFGAPRVANYEYFRLLKTPVYRIVNSSDVVPRVPPGAIMIALRALFQLLAWLTAVVAPPVSTLFTRVEEFTDKLSGYRHHGDLRYLTDVAEGQFHTVRLLSNPPAIDRLVWMWRRLGKSILVPVKSHGMEIYRRKLRSIANARDTS